MSKLGDTPIVLVCCKCDPDAELDNNAVVLLREHCPKHGMTWHRKMVRDASGRMRLAIPVKRPRSDSGDR